MAAQMVEGKYEVDDRYAMPDLPGLLADGRCETVDQSLDSVFTYELLFAQEQQRAERSRQLARTWNP